MKVKKIVLAFSSEDIKNFLKLQDKVRIKEIIINDKVHFYGQYNILKVDVDFEGVLEFLKVVNNHIYVDIKSFKILKRNILNSLSKKVFNYVIKAFSEMEGVKFHGEHFVIDVLKVSEKYTRDFQGLDFKKFEAKDIGIEEGEVLVTFGGITIDTSVMDSDENVPYVDAEIVDESGATLDISLDDMKKYEKEFNEESFFQKIKNYGKTAGVSVVYAALILYYTYKDKNVPLKVKAISLGALGYFILPTDLIPDIFVVAGYTDDLIALVTAIQSITAYINDDIKLKARTKLDEWFDSIEEKDIDKVNEYL